MGTRLGYLDRRVIGALCAAPSCTVGRVKVTAFRRGTTKGLDRFLPKYQYSCRHFKRRLEEVAVKKTVVIVFAACLLLSLVTAASAQQCSGCGIEDPCGTSGTCGDKKCPCDTGGDCVCVESDDAGVSAEETTDEAGDPAGTDTEEASIESGEASDGAGTSVDEKEPRTQSSLPVVPIAGAIIAGIGALVGLVIKLRR